VAIPALPAVILSMSAEPARDFRVLAILAFNELAAIYAMGRFTRWLVRSNGS
jgi:hypothetical protein